MVGGYYDREGNPICRKSWSERHSNIDYKRVAQDELPNGMWVSTVWLGMDHRFGEGPPLIFETMVFPNTTDLCDLDCDRYSTEAEALAGHKAMVEKYKSGDGNETN